MIKYKSGYKYQLVEHYHVQTDITPSEDILITYIGLTKTGRLWVRDGYCWDGPSGPAIDTKNFMRGSLIHDALYELMRKGCINQEWRKQADLELKKACIEDGMSKIRAWWVYQAVKTFAKRCTDSDNKRKVLTAP